MRCRTNVQLVNWAEGKEKGKAMRKGFLKKRILLGAVTVAALAGGIFSGSKKDADAATRKCYTISTGNTTVYSNTGLSVRYGTIFDSDELIVQTVTGSYCRVTYPISRGTKTGYIPTSAILRGTTGSDYRSRARITTLKRPGGASYGYVDTGDVVRVLGTYGDYTQIKYPVSGGYKYAFIATSSANAYIYPQQQTVQQADPAPVIENSNNDDNNTSIVQITYNGQIVDTFNGVAARYITGTGNSNTGTYCCARYVSNYYSSVYGVSVANMFTGRTPSASSGYFYRTYSPQAGDIGYQLNSRNSGHWFIIKSVNGDGSYTIIEQNWKWNDNGRTVCNKNRKVYNSTRGFKVFRWSGR